MIRNQPISASRTGAKRRAIFLPLATMALLAITCISGGLSTDESPPASQPTRTESPAEPTDAPPGPPTAEPTVDPGMIIWNRISGMWSGCPSDTGGRYFLDVCPTDQDFPTGPFITLYLSPSCNIGEACGVYVKGTFSSEFIAYELTFEGYVQGHAQFYAESSSGESLDHPVYIGEIEGHLEIDDSGSEIYQLSPGCNPLIGDNFGCLYTMPG